MRSFRSIARALAALLQSLRQDTAPAIVPSAQSTTQRRPLVDGNNAFAFDLYHAIKDEQENIIFSPYSISQALAMVYLGAHGTTAQEMADTLHFTLPQEDFHPAFRAMQQYLNRPSYDDTVVDSQLYIANALWGQAGYPFRDAYLSQLDHFYRTELHRADFKNAAEEARLAINDWISEATEGRIQNLLQPGSILPLTLLVLINAIYFKAAWRCQFSDHNTKKEPFALLDGGVVSVDMMQRPADYSGYASSANYQALSLDYHDQRMTMLLALPERGRFAAVDALMNGELLQEIVTGLEHVRVVLSMPRFKTETTLDLIETLAKMGMAGAFGGSADFSGVADPAKTKEPVMINRVIHRANITVDEKGTEAAAATVVSLYRSARPPDEPLDFRVDRPFLYYIYDTDSRAILLMGRVLDPTAG